MTYWNLHKKFELPMTNVHRDLTFQSWVFLIGGEPNNCSAVGRKEHISQKITSICLYYKSVICFRVIGTGLGIL